MAELGLAASARSSDANVKARETRPGGNIVQERAILSSTFNYDKIRKIGYHLILSLCKGLELFPQRDSGYTILSYLSNTLARAADHPPPSSPVAGAQQAAPSLRRPPPRPPPRAHSPAVVLADGPSQIRRRERLLGQGRRRAAVLGHHAQHVPAVTKPCGWAKRTASGRDGAAAARRKTRCPHSRASHAPAPDRSAARSQVPPPPPGWGVGMGGEGGGQPAMPRMELFDARNALTLGHAQGRERSRRRL